MERKNSCAPSETCKYYPNCYEDWDHTYWPAKDYKTVLEREFRSLPQNKAMVCRRLHDERHTLPPPEKPSHAEMLQAIGKLGLESIGDCK